MHAPKTAIPLENVATEFIHGNDDNNPQSLHAEEVREKIFIHPDARTLFARAPFLRYIPLFGEATEGYGPKAVFSLGMSYFLCKGLSDYLVRYSQLAMYMDHFGVDGTVYQRMENVSGMGWSIKPLTAAISDIFPFFGYTKRWYMFASCVVGSSLSLAYGFLPPVESSAPVAAGLVFVNCFTKANVDILTEGHYSRMMRRVPGPGPSLVSWIWWFIIAGSLISVSVVGPLGDAGFPYIPPFIATVLQLATCVFFIFNFFDEHTNREERCEDARILYEETMKAKSIPLALPASDEQEGKDSGNQVIQPINAEPDMLGYDSSAPYGSSACDVEKFTFVEPHKCCCGVFEINEEVFFRNPRVVIYSVLMACCVVTVAISSILGSTSDLLIAAIVVSCVHCGFNFYALPMIVAKANLFSFLQMASGLRFPGAFSAFFRAGPDCVPDGPNFNLFFLQTVAGVVSSFTAILGIWMFNYIFSKKTYRMTFIVTVLLGVLTSFFDLIIVMRWNLPYVSDKVVYILGNAVVAEVISMLNWMPMILLLSRLCPRGSESTVYAILAASGNLGQSMASTIGSLIMEYALPVKTRVPCDFSNLMMILIIGGFLTPLLQIPLTIFLIPSARMCDDIDLSGAPKDKKKNKKVISTDEQNSPRDVIAA